MTAEVELLAADALIMAGTDMPVVDQAWIADKIEIQVLVVAHHGHPIADIATQHEHGQRVANGMPKQILRGLHTRDVGAGEVVADHGQPRRKLRRHG